jgi:hypothetical protein
VIQSIKGQDVRRTVGEPPMSNTTRGPGLDL